MIQNVIFHQAVLLLTLILFNLCEKDKEKRPLSSQSTRDEVDVLEINKLIHNTFETSYKVIGFFLNHDLTG